MAVIVTFEAELATIPITMESVEAVTVATEPELLLEESIGLFSIE